MGTRTTLEHFVGLELLAARDEITADVHVHLEGGQRRDRRVVAKPLDAAELVPGLLFEFTSGGVERILAGIPDARRAAPG